MFLPCFHVSKANSSKSKPELMRSPGWFLSNEPVRARR